MDCLFAYDFFALCSAVGVAGDFDHYTFGIAADTYALEVVVFSVG